METREQRGLEIAATKKLSQKDDLWLVPSSTGRGTYVVDGAECGDSTCTCPDFELHQEPCKHVFAVSYTLRRERTTPNGTVTETITYRQEWAAYNAAQTNEKVRVAQLLRDLCSAVDNPIQKRGRPRLPISDSLFCAAMKVYGGMSARRTTCDLRDFAERGLIDKAPHYNSVLNALENPELTPILHALIEESAKPLAAIETDFAVDSSGFSSSEYRRWFSTKYGREMAASKFLKAHIMVGTKTNVVTAVEVTDAFTHDIHMFKPVLQRTAQRFNVQRVSADKAYSSSRILALVDEAGAEAYIPFKARATGKSPGIYSTTTKGRELWTKAFHYFMYQREDFLKAYHRRSNVETTFSMIKAKFGSRIRSKTDTAQVNEILCKILCHNVCVLVQSIYELGIEATFWHKDSVA